MTLPSTSAADALNQACYCRTLDEARLLAILEADPCMHGLAGQIAATRPHLFSATAVFLAPPMAQAMTDAVAAIARVCALPGYRTQALARAPAVARHAFGPGGACMGYDFHLGEAGPQLIEINTNAGGLLLNVALAHAQRSCCVAMNWSCAPAAADSLEQDVFDMFAAEWRSQRGTAPLGTVLIVDHRPSDQYLAPEFELFRLLFERHGLRAAVADPSALSWRDGKLWHGEMAVDMVYNRLTDFYLDEPDQQALRAAWEAGAVVLTPDPHAHALFADKRNLIALSDDALLAQWGASDSDRALLRAAVPKTELVTPERADALWAQRRALFFKPVAGYGAKAAYRGDKLTRRVWDEILAGDFVAQALVQPGRRAVTLDGAPGELKFDLRAYAYGAKVQLLAARMYQGQTTNFRTPGGGFAPTIIVPPETDGAAGACGAAC